MWLIQDGNGMFRTGLFQLSSTFTKVLLTLLTGVSRVTGDEIPGWRDLDLAEVHVAIYFEGDLKASRVRGQTFSEMLAGLHWAVNLLRQRGFGFQKGHTITTGAIAHTLAEPGEQATVRYGDEGEFGEIQITIA